MIYHHLSLMFDLHQRNIHDFTQDPHRIIQVKKLIYECFLTYNLSQASDMFKHIMDSVYADHIPISETIAYLRHNTHVITYQEDNTIVGILISKNNKITHLFVDVHHHKQWIWAKLLCFFEQLIKQAWYTSIYLKSSTYAEQFYKHHWFFPKNDLYLEKQL